jgi:hypothetical protein
VSAQVEPATIHLGESARFSLVFTSAPQSALRFPKLPQVPGLRFRYEGQSSAMNIVNGRTSISLSFNYRIVPERKGEFTIPAIELRVGAEHLRTRPVKLTVLDRDQALPRQSGAQPRWAYLALTPGKKEAFVGERVPVEISLYFRSNARDYAPQPLRNPGFVFGGLEPLGQQQVRRGDVIYRVVRHQQNAFPSKAGELTLGPAEASLTLLIPKPRRRSNDPFADVFNFDPFGLQADVRPVQLRSQPVTLHVKPLPSEGRPAGFTGAVGQYEMSVTASPTNVAVGEPVHLKIRIHGQGLLDNVSVPTGRGPEWEGFKVYPPRMQTDLTDRLRALGTKIFEQDIVPQRPDLREIPALRFSFFDPEQGQYRTLTHPAQPLLVRPASRAQALAPLPAGANPQAPPKPAVPRELAPLKERLGPPALIRPPLLTRGWFWLLLLAPVGGCGAAWGWRRRVDHLARNPRLARRLAFGRVRRRLLGELRELARKGDATAFFAHAFRLLQEQLGERLDLPAAAITEAVIEERLRPAGVPEAVLKDLHELFQICNQARYAPVAESKDLPGVARRIEAVLNQVRHLDL